MHTKTLKNLKDTRDLAHSRKNDHIAICTHQNVESLSKGFDSVSFVPEALPETDFHKVSTASKFLGRSFDLPILISGMTGGVIHGQRINEILAFVAEKYNIPMGLGSQKIMITDPSLKSLFNVRYVAPNAFIMGNLGAVSFNYGISVSDVQKCVDDLKLDAFALHLNALQESIQPEGERNFRDLLVKIADLVRHLHVPVLVKEVGSGISALTCSKLIEAGVQAIDVGGRGGTSWGFIEGQRGSPVHNRLGELFKNWGLSTCQSLIACYSVKNHLKSCVDLVATGGMRNGLDVAKAVALGASMCGVGLPFFKKAVSAVSFDEGVRAVEEELLYFSEALRIAMFCSGAVRVQDLQDKIVHEIKD